MSKIDYDIKIECPNCGEVHIRSKEFLSASYDKSGWITVSFACPTCDAAVEFKSNLGLEIVTELSTELVSKMTSAFANAKPADEGSTDSSEGKDKKDNEMQVVKVPITPESSTETDNKTDTEADTPADAAANINPPKPQQKNDSKSPLNISYMAVADSPMMSFGVHLEAKEKPVVPSITTPRVPTEEDKARIEYFHRQIESLDTVDDAIDEIETGYHLRDQDEDNE